LEVRDFSSARGIGSGDGGDRKDVEEAAAEHAGRFLWAGGGERKRRKCRPNVLLGLIRTTKSAYLDIGLERFRYDGLRNLKTSIGLTQ
jgi:hypothetical protein